MGAVEVEVDVGEEGEGSGQAGDVVFFHVDGDSVVSVGGETDVGEHNAEQCGRKRGTGQEAIDNTSGARSPKPCEEEVLRAEVADVVARQVECGDVAVGAL